MPGKDLIPYDPNDPHHWRSPKRTLSQRVGDVLEAYFTERPRYNVTTWLLDSIKLAIKCVVIVAVFIVFMTFTTWLGLKDKQPPWLRESFFTAVKNVMLSPETMKVIVAVASMVFAPFFVYRTANFLREAVPAYFHERKAKRLAGEQRKKDQAQQYREGVARNERENSARKQARIDAHHAQQAEHQRRVVAYVQWRREQVAAVEREIQVEVARAKQEVFMTNDNRPDGPVLVVRKWMQDTYPKPAKWGFLHESEDMTIRRILINSGGWMPPSPPHPTGIDPRQLAGGFQAL